MKGKPIFPRALRQDVSRIENNNDFKFNDYEYLLNEAVFYERIALLKYKDDTVKNSKLIESDDYLVEITDDNIRIWDVEDSAINILIEKLTICDKNGLRLLKMRGLEIVYHESNDDFEIYFSTAEGVRVRHSDGWLMIDPKHLLDVVLDKANKVNNLTRENGIQEMESWEQDPLRKMKTSQSLIIDFINLVNDSRDANYVLFFTYEEELNFVKKGEVSIRVIDYLNSIGEYCVESQHCHEVKAIADLTYMKIIYELMNSPIAKTKVLDLCEFKVIDIFTSCFYDNDENKKFNLKRKGE